LDQGAGVIGLIEGIGGALGDLPAIGEDGLGLEALLPFGAQRGIIEEALSGGAFGGQVDTSDQALINSNIAASLYAISEAEIPAKEGAEELADSLALVGEEASKSSTAIETLRTELDELNGTQQTVDEGAINVRENQRALLDSLVGLEGGYRAGTEQGDAFLGTARQLASSIRDQTIAVLENGQGADAARIAQAGYTEGLRRVLRQANFTEEEIDDLINTYARVPEREITQFETPGLEQARSGARGLKQDIDRIPPGKNIRVNFEVTGFDQVISAVQSAANAVIDVPVRAQGREAAVNTRAVPRPQVALNDNAATGVTTLIEVNVDARGASDPQGVGREVARALAPHRQKMAVRLNRRGG
jgi:hypothetical protein